MERAAPAGEDPRLERTREAALVAARDLLIEDGWASVTHAKVAERARIGRATVYRHWPTTADLAVAAARSFGRIHHSTPTGALRADLIAELKAFGSAFREGPLRPLMVSLIELAVFHDEFVDVRGAVHAEGSSVLRRVLAEAIEQGGLPADTDVGEMLALLMGPLIYEALVVGADMTDLRIERVVDITLDAASARTHRSPAARAP